MDCATAFQLIARECLAKMDAQRLGTIAGDAEALHQMRVAISQFRAAVAFFAPMTSDATMAKRESELEWVYAILGDARDADVMAALIRRKRYRKWAQQVGARDPKERDRLYRLVVACMRSARFQRLTGALSRWVERGPWLTRQDQDAQRRKEMLLTTSRQPKLKRWHASLVRKGRGLASMGDKSRHRFRLKGKRYRYVLESLSAICPPSDRAQLRRLQQPMKDLQRALGDLRDLQRLRHIGTSPSRPPGYRKHKKELLAEAREAFRDIKQTPPIL
ncbi:MAG TPA: CHAD domain-containing protein [Xanthobacteraceae bacterium]|jgi:CHAD domain-containing protein